MIFTPANLRRFACPLATCIGLFTFVAPVAAQHFTFEKKKYTAEPGQTLQLDIYAGDFPEPLAGLNYTVRVSEKDSALVRLQDATSFSPLVNPAYDYSDHRLSRFGVTSGVIHGNVQELRGVLYATSDLLKIDYPFSRRTKLATLMVPIDINAQGRVLIELVGDVDNGVALLGGSTREGDAALPEGRPAPFGDLASIVVKRGTEPTVTDFKNPENHTGWIYQGLLPATGDPQPVGESIAGEGLQIRALVDDSYGYWSWDFQNRGAWTSPPANVLLVTDWLVESDASGTAVPPIRLRVMTDNHTLSSEALIQDLPENNDSVSITPTAQGRTYRTLSYVPPFAADGYSDDGMNPYFDLLQFDYGKVGTTVTLEKLTERYVSPASLPNPQTIYSQTFDSTTDGGWLFGRGDYGGRDISYSRSRYGLGITSAGPLELLPGDDYLFSYGYWYSPHEALQVEANSGKWYRVRGMIHGTAENPQYNPMVRFRVYPPNNEFFAGQMFAPVLDPADYHMPRPNLDGMQFEMWFTTPPEFDGWPLAIAFDMIHLDAPADGSDQTPSLFLKWITVTTYDAPVLPDPQTAS